MFSFQLNNDTMIYLQPLKGFLKPCAALHNFLNKKKLPPESSMGHTKNKSEKGNISPAMETDGQH